MCRKFLLLALLTLSLAVMAQAQGRKAGLWEMTTTTEIKQSPFPAMPNGTNPFAAPHTTQICVTQAELDKYNAIVSPITHQKQNDCKITSINKTANGMTAQLTCSGHMTGTATAESSWTDSAHATGGMHFTGTMQMGPNSKPFEFITHSSSVFKSADCGSVKPLDNATGN